MTERELELSEALDVAICYIQDIIGSDESKTLDYLVKVFNGENDEN